MNTLPKVTVLLSTFNGEKYIQPLLDSVLAQRDVEVRIVVRDDGSTDKTLDIISSYPQSQIIVYKGDKNVGPAKSFLYAIQFAEESEYYAYCDQDDVWNEEKLIHGVRMLEKADKEEPSLYMSTYEVVDESLKTLFVRNMEYERPFTLQQTLLCRAPSGCTMIFNNALCKLLKRQVPEHIRMHDFWTLLTVEALHGNIFTENWAALKYRQHGDNTVGIIPDIKTRMVRLLKSMIEKPNERSLQANALYACYGDILPKDSKETILEVMEYKQGIGKKFRLLLDKDFSWNFYTNVLFKLSVFIGVF